ncbi:MAG: pilus assembly FimT family protein [Opitutaceae bacterium]
MTSAIGKFRRPSRGFTIIEVVLVLGLIALAASIMIVNVTSIAERGGDLNPEETLKAAIRKARYVAADKGTVVTIQYDEESGDLILSSGDRFDLGVEYGEEGRGKVNFFLVQPSEGLSPLTDPEDARIEVSQVRFAPDRSSNPFVVEMDSGTGTPQRLVFDPFSSLQKKAKE